MIRQKEFWYEIFNFTKNENIKIINSNLAGPSDILEAQLQPILWCCLRDKGIVSVVESSFDPEKIRKKLDLIFEYNQEYYLVEIKRNGLGLENYGKTYTDSVDRFEEDFQKLNKAQQTFEAKYHKQVNKIFIVIQYFEKKSQKYDKHKSKFQNLLSIQSDDWINGHFFEFGGLNDAIYLSNKGDICLGMKILIADKK